MAANNYYSSFDDHNTSYQGAGRLDAPLPSVPHSSPPNNHSVSSVHSPFDDYAYPAPHPPPKPSGGYPRPYDSDSSFPHSYNNETDPFADNIPLQPQSHKPRLDATSSPTGAMGDAELGHDGKNSKRSSKQGWFKGKITYAVFALSVVQIIVFIAEIAKNATLTGTPIEIKPNFNPMIGPSPYVLINMGARYVPCMREYDIPGKNITFASPTVSMQCPNATTNTADCTLSDLCGFGLNLTPRPDGTQPQPNQWFRFIVPIFLHGGIIHISFNLLLQLTLGRDVEKQIGTLRFLLVYFSAGIFGFVFGGNFAPNGILSTGCSGALFGILALVLLDLLYTWKSRDKPGRDLAFIILDVAIAFVIGLLPALDNFSHIGGFLTGLVLGICILHSPDALRKRTGLDEPPYSSVGAASTQAHGHTPGIEGETGVQAFARQPVGFFRGRKPLWWVWWLLRVGALVAVLVSFIVLLRNFYKFRTQCSWCKYLSCLPIKNWCDLGNIQFSEPATKLRMLVRGDLTLL